MASNDSERITRVSKKLSNLLRHRALKGTAPKPRLNKLQSDVIFPVRTDPV